MLLWIQTLDLAFGGFTVYPAEGSKSYILLAIRTRVNFTRARSQADPGVNKLQITNVLTFYHLAFSYDKVVN
jgi:hypothetical protein